MRYGNFVRFSGLEIDAKRYAVGINFLRSCFFSADFQGNIPLFRVHELQTDFSFRRNHAAVSGRSNAKRLYRFSAFRRRFPGDKLREKFAVPVFRMRVLIHLVFAVSVENFHRKRSGIRRSVPFRFGKRQNRTALRQHGNTFQRAEQRFFFAVRIAYFVNVARENIRPASCGQPRFYSRKPVFFFRRYHGRHQQSAPEIIFVTVFVSFLAIGVIIIRRFYQHLRVFIRLIRACVQKRQ